MKKLSLSLLLILSLILSMAAALTGCSSSGKDSAETSAAQSQASTEAAEASETSQAAANSSEASAAYQGISFETTDLDGNAVTAEELFSQHKLTMINLWGTYCGPCIGEMPDLEILSQRLAEKDCAIVGVVVDVAGLEDTARLETAREIIADTGVKIDINDDGTVFIASPDEAAAAKAKEIIDGIVKDIEVGDVYLGTVVGIKEFGAFINLKPGTDGLLHISRIANKRVEKVEDVLQMGEQVLVRVIDIDKKTGKISLTRKDLLPQEKN